MVESEENFTSVVFVCLSGFCFSFPQAAGCLPVVSNPPEFIPSTTRQN